MEEPHPKETLIDPNIGNEPPPVNNEVIAKTEKGFSLKFKSILKYFLGDFAPSNEGVQLDKPVYHSLSPTDDADDDNAYFAALKWALDNKKSADIKNIALTGPYGSGKSSILKTFQKRNKDKSLYFLNISLATFKEELQEEGEEAPADEDTLRLIELSILQQIFYHEKDEKIPDSRFAKIKSLPRKKAILLTGLLLISILSILNIVYPDYLPDLLGYPLISTKFVIGLGYLANFIALCALAYLCYIAVRFSRSMQISKLNFSHAEIQMGGDLNKSVLNQNLEEILYFFEVTPYNVVIIEDLDRFQRTEVFTKLRELNLLINGSKKSDKEVVFIYSVRDDMFQDKDRIKFFDFIIPVIPHINSSNSNEILSKKLKDFTISTELIEDIALFIDDMRLLYNIVNEYYVYHQKLNKTLKQDNLLAIIVYKNIYPNDFMLLSQEKGILYSELSKKDKYVGEKVQELRKESAALTKQIIVLESLKIKDVNELRSIYVIQYLNQVTNIAAFNINNTEYKIGDVLRDDLFEYFKKNAVRYKYYLPTNRHGQFTMDVADLPLKFTEVEKRVSEDFSYAEREQQIIDWNKQKVEALKRQIESNEIEIIRCKSLRLKNLLLENSNKQKKQETHDSRLTDLLVRKGYIDEDYLDYISIFHEGSLTKDDNTFLINVKTQTSSLFTAKLYHIENLLKRISESYFETPYILNFSLLDFIIDNNQYQTQCKLLFEQLVTEKEIVIGFIDQYIERGIKTENFITKLCSYWKNIWGFINDQATYTEEKKGKYFKLILDNGSMENIMNISQSSNLRSLIISSPRFLSLLNSDEKTKDIIKSLGIRFNNLKFETSENTLLDFVYKGNYYEINIHMLQYILKGLNSFDQVVFDTKNFKAIKNANAPELLQFVQGNINKYLEQVYFKLESNTQEDEIEFLDLLKDEKVSAENKSLLIDKVTTKITTIESNLNTINEVLFGKSRIKPSWDSAVTYFATNEKRFTDGLNAFLNNKLNVDELVKIDYPPNNINEDVKAEFSQAFLINNALENSVYEMLIEKVAKESIVSNFTGLDSKKVEILLAKGKIPLSIGNYNELKKDFPGLHIQLLLNKHDDYMKSIGDYDLNEHEILSLLKGEFTPLEKIQILLSKGSEFLISSSTLLKLMANTIVANTQLGIGKDIIKAILIRKSLGNTEWLMLLNAQKSLFDSSEILEIVTSFNPSLSGSTETIEVENNKTNRELAEILKEKGLIKGWEVYKKGLKIFPVKTIQQLADLSELLLSAPNFYCNILNKASNKAVDVNGGSWDDGALIHLWVPHGDDNQTWEVRRSEGNEFGIIAKHSGKCLEVKDNSMDNEAPIQQNMYQGLRNQLWQIIENGDGSCRIISLSSGKCLEADSRSVFNDGGAIIQYDYADADHQKWILRPISIQ